jgi:hypothetical protein
VSSNVPVNPCPICGLSNPLGPPDDGMICPCCGTEFGYDDFATSHAELRQRWIAEGARWWSPNMAPPSGWNAHVQVQALLQGDR